MNETRAYSRCYYWKLYLNSPFPDTHYVPIKCNMLLILIYSNRNGCKKHPLNLIQRGMPILSTPTRVAQNDLYSFLPWDALSLKMDEKQWDNKGMLHMGMKTRDLTKPLKMRWHTRALSLVWWSSSCCKSLSKSFFISMLLSCREINPTAKW